MRYFSLLITLLSSQLALAQSFQELRTDVLMPFFKVINISYEYMPTSRIGIEADVYHLKTAIWLTVPPVRPSCYDCYGDPYEFKQHEFHLTLAGKYYFFKKHPGAGLLAGIYLHTIVETFREKGYGELYQSINGESPAPGRQLHFGIGPLIGYKWVIARHYIVEPGIGMDYGNFYQTWTDSYANDWSGILGVKAGYRW